MQIKFTIKGNHLDPEGNPIPYLRMTQKQHWKPEVQRYAEWLDYIRTQVIQISQRTQNISKKPYTTSKEEPARMDIKIYYKNRAHGDPDNIWKALADALFKSDKYLDGSFESQIAQDGEGRVEVTITINEKQYAKKTKRKNTIQAQANKRTRKRRLEQAANERLSPKRRK